MIHSLRSISGYSSVFSFLELIIHQVNQGFSFVILIPYSLGEYESNITTSIEVLIVFKNVDVAIAK